mmetsp:Transcript_29874/g.55380  ORF Transcript_29874/g.55380 Transcript_29874/m.55380 type:complete len:642 (-) Transcript_29874:2520-4445(-)
MASNNTPFIPKHLVVLAELETREKEQYYNIMLNNGSKFHRTENGQYVLNMRILAPGVKKQANAKRREQQVSNSLPFEERLQRLQSDNPISVTFGGQAELFDYSSYPRFSVLIANDGDSVSPRPKLLSWLMRAIEEIYDARFAHEAAEVGRGESDLVAEQVSSLFPAFVVKRLSTKVGLRSLVDQTCWDLLYNSHVYRRDYLEVEMFCRFLQEFYDHDDLLFFLYVRSVVAKQLHVSFKTRWTKNDGPGRQPKSLWLSHRECVHVAKTVFGDANESMCRDFLSIVQPQMVGQKATPAADGKPQQPDSRRIDITQFLHLAVVGYHQTRPDDQDQVDPAGGLDPRQQNPFGGHGNGDGGDGMVFGMGSAGAGPSGGSPTPLPSRSPSGGGYMSRFNPRESASGHVVHSGNVYPNQDVYDRGEGQFSEEDEYLSRLQRDREELQRMQQEQLDDDQGQDFRDEMLDGQDFNDPSMSGQQLDSSFDMDDLNLTPDNAGKPSGGGQSLADFAKQRQQMAELDQAYSSPTVPAPQGDDEQYDGGGSDEPENLDDIRHEREQEFLQMSCAPVYEFPEDIAGSIVDELADRLHHKMTAALGEEARRRPQGLPDDPDEYDDIVVTCLQSDDLQADMAAARDLMLTYVKDRMG